MSKSLGLVGDGDDLDLFVDLEAAFGIGITDPEAEGCWTVGDIHNVLLDRLRTADSLASSCVTAMAFYRLRRAFVSLGAKGKIRPENAISSLTSLKPKELSRYLKKQTGLRLLHRSGIPAAIGTSIILLASIGLLAALAIRPGAWWLAAAMAGIGASFIYWDGGKLPANCVTLGDLAKTVAANNFGRLVIEGARPREPDVWTALVEVLAEHSSLGTTEIGRETRILGKR